MQGFKFDRGRVAEQTCIWLAYWSGTASCGMITPYKSHFFEKQRKWVGELLGNRSKRGECVALKGKMRRKKLQY